MKVRPKVLYVAEEVPSGAILLDKNMLPLIDANRAELKDHANDTGCIFRIVAYDRRKVANLVFKR